MFIRLKSLHYLLIVSFLSCHHQIPTPIRFLSEEIKISIDSASVRINGVYIFQNIATQTKTALIYYPFPIDNYHTYPDSISTSIGSYTKSDSGIYFPITFQAHSQETLYVFYRQSLTANQSRYILSTTQKWRYPLQKAIFTIDIDTTHPIKDISYQPQRTYIFNNRLYYYLEKRNFKPSTDLIIKW